MWAHKDDVIRCGPMMTRLRHPPRDFGKVFIDFQDYSKCGPSTLLFLSAIYEEWKRVSGPPKLTVESWKATLDPDSFTTVDFIQRDGSTNGTKAATILGGGYDLDIAKVFIDGQVVTLS